MKKTLGEIAFDAFGDSWARDGILLNRKEWGKMQDHSRRGWENSARAVANKCAEVADSDARQVDSGGIVGPAYSFGRKDAANAILDLCKVKL